MIHKLKKNRVFHYAAWILSSLLIFVLFSACSGTAPYEDLWLANFQGQNVFLYLKGNRAFYAEGRWDVEVAPLTMSGNTGTITIDDIIVNLSLSGDDLTFTFGRETLSFRRSTAPAAHNHINGEWYAPGGWSLYFIRNRVFIIDNDGVGDNASYEFTPGSGGTFTTVFYGYDFVFNVNGNNLSAMVENPLGGNTSLNFSRQR